MKLCRIGPWECYPRELTIVLWIVSTLEFEGIYWQNSLTGRVSKALRRLRRIYYPWTDEQFLELLRSMDKIKFQVPCSTLWGDTLTEPKAVRQYQTFLGRMRCGEPASGFPDLIDRINNPPIVSEAVLKMLQPYMPELHFDPKEIDWRDLGFGPGSFANKHQKSSHVYSKISRLRIAHTHPCDFCKGVEVPKTFKQKRQIATCPLNEQMLQYPVSRYLMKVTEISSRGAIRYRDQSYSRDKCNLDHDTLDQTAASDLVRLIHVKYTAEAAYGLLCRLRTKYIVINKKKYPLNNMFATMGSPLTFPTETWVFYSLTYAICKMCGATEEELRQIVVYGDDIIVPHKYGEVNIYFFELLGFIPNRSKSFFSENELFRETCGAETYAGIDITPARMPRGATIEWYLSMSIGQMADLVSNFDTHYAWVTAEILSEFLFPGDKSEYPFTPSTRCSGVWELRGTQSYKRALPWLQTVGFNDESAIVCVMSSLTPYLPGRHDTQQYYPPYKKDKSIAHLPCRTSSPISVSETTFYANHRRFWRQYWLMKEGAARGNEFLSAKQADNLLAGWRMHEDIKILRALFQLPPGDLFSAYSQKDYERLRAIFGENIESEYKERRSKL